MVRTAQIARDPNAEPRRWIKREYVDHEGNTVILGKVVSYARQFYSPEEGEAYRLQVYSTTPIQPEELNQLYKYFCFDLAWLPFLEIYSYNPPDGLACVEHQRREVAHRKRLHAEQRAGEYDESLPPLIPTMRAGFQDGFMSGFCFLLTSKSYLWGLFPNNDHGTGPWQISFDRNLPSAVKELDLVRRLDKPASELETFAEWGIAVNPEIRDINVDITTDQSVIHSDMKERLRGIYSTYAYGEIDYGLHEPPPPAPSDETPTAQYIQEVLEQQTGDDVQSDSLRLITRTEDNTVTVTNNPDGESDLQYVIYVKFLAHIEGGKTALLETTARTFTAGIISCLAASKTVYFEFRIPGPSLSSLISAAPDGFDVGALHEYDGSITRVQPLIGRELYTRPLRPHFFTVVLDKPAIIQEPSLLFYTLWSDPLQYLEPESTDSVIEIGRSAGIREAARRLAMLAVEEKLTDSPRKLTKEEHRGILSLSAEEYEHKMKPYYDYLEKKAMSAVNN
ncbi:hypothetical protein ASPVEDRAFT_70519 [Aspergillus versicolor CBS 583.65]|uniref:Uncharacterized protein n=1 Tax=Aspergillus versicolor CBS 583.65 TaxID=1036611 RepID=A0A1L9PFI8_ASPVE|nr:uncharacterized protein ASPVEDRAFT_70519 [Aspergillus versicolor CBS 583.65]OJJ00270.1 hypothetical protein ASPVEDRAFT_70519 [Aspergillus versicolor CBS 583.65]